MPTIPFAEWVPDSADLGNPGSPAIINAVPAVNSYRSHPSLVPTTSALTDRPRGAIEGIDKQKNVYQYCGDEDNLYVLSGSTWTDISKLATTYTTTEEERWEFVRWKEKIIATNYDDDPQQITFGGANFSDLTTALRFRHVAVVGDFVVAGNTYDGTDGAVRDRVRWSAINDETDWTVSPTTLSDFRDLKAGGGIQQIIGGQYGVILSENSVYRMAFVGTPKVFQIDEVLPGVGLVAPGGAAILAGTVYFPSEHGFVALRGGTQEQFIGSGRVDEYFSDDLDRDYLHRVSSIADPNSNRVYWAYPGAGNTGGRPNKIIMYDVGLNKWGHLETEIELLWRAGGVGQTLEQLDSISTNIDTLGISLDDPQFKGSAPLLAGFDENFESGSFSGAGLTAVFTTREQRLHTGFKCALNGFKPLVDGGTTTARVGTRNKLADDVVWGPPLTQRSSGQFRPRGANKSFHRFELTVTGDFKDAIGVQIDPKDAPRSEGRG